jgi:hypothetical protein
VGCRLFTTGFKLTGANHVLHRGLGHGITYARMGSQLAPIGTSTRCVQIHGSALQRLAHVATGAAGRGFMPGSAV